MNSDRIAHRINDLLKLSGLKDDRIIEELTDHYLTHIEEETRRGVNAQKAIREAYQEIANIDAKIFNSNNNMGQKRGLLLFFILFVGMAFYLFFHQNDLEPIQQSMDLDKTTALTPPDGLPLKQPNLQITSGFGMKFHPLNQEKVLHQGIDFKAKLGTPVFTTGDGIVSETGYSVKSGNYIAIKHNDQFITKYLHLEEFTVAKNDRVKEGDLIGKVGSSGMSLMPHLHYEIIKNEVHVDPKIYINP